MRLLMSTLNMELELSTKSASDVHCGFLTNSLNFVLVVYFLFPVFFFFFFFFFFYSHLIFFSGVAGSFNVKKSSSETFGTARGIGEEIEFIGSDFGP